MRSQQLIRAYMRTLTAHLGKLDPAESQEVVREIESHLHDVLEQAEARGDTPDVAALLAGFGPPEALAARYVAHVQEGAPPPSGFGVIQSVKRTATRGLYYAMGAFGFSIAAAFLLLALAKVWEPASVGVWSLSGASTVIITWSGSPHPQAQEMFGYGLVPFALLACLSCAELTRRVLIVLRRGLF
jgi:hypothetical protein